MITFGPFFVWRLFYFISSSLRCNGSLFVYFYIHWFNFLIFRRRMKTLLFKWHLRWDLFIWAQRNILSKNILLNIIIHYYYHYYYHYYFISIIFCFVIIILINNRSRRSSSRIKVENSSCSSDSSMIPSSEVEKNVDLVEGMVNANHNRIFEQKISLNLRL